MTTSPETPQDDTATQIATEPADAEENPSADEPDTGNGYSREYVDKIRNEAANHRTKARDAEARNEELSRELFTNKVAATGRLTDPTDLPYSAEALADPDLMNQQIDELLKAKPHFGVRTPAPVGNVGLGVKDAGSANGAGWLSTLKTMV